MLHAFHDNRNLLAPLTDADGHARLHAERRNVHLLTVDQNVAVVHQLTGTGDGGGIAKTEANAIQTGFQKHQKVCARNTAHTLGFFKRLTHLTFHQTVVRTDFLLFQQLYAVNRHLPAHILTVLSGGVWTLVRGAFRTSPDTRSKAAAKFVFGSKILAHSARVFPFRWTGEQIVSPCLIR